MSSLLQAPGFCSSIHNYFFSLTRCVDFDRTFELPPNMEFLLVRCKSAGKATYTNTHAIVRDRPDIRETLDQYEEESEKRPLSVLMLSIDSISRLNLIRAMPMTAQHVYDTGWFELQGYNKVCFACDRRPIEETLLPKISDR